MCLTVAGSEQAVLTAGDSQQNQPEVKEQGRSAEEQSMEASSDASRSHGQEKEDREKRKEAKVGGFFSSHTHHHHHHRASFCVFGATADVFVTVLLLADASFFHNLRVRFTIGSNGGTDGNLG